MFWIVITGLNFLPVSFYGELEFWFAMIKVITVLGFLIFGICIDAGAGQQGYLGFHTWGNPGAFANYILDPGPTAKFVGFWAVLIQAGFSYQGTELVGVAAAECANPRKVVPSAIKKTFWRILLFFVGTIFFIGLLIPYTNDGLLSTNSDASASPFVIAAQLAGVKSLPGIINAVLLCVVLSAANSNVYSGSRILVGLANEGHAPKFFTITTKGGVPYIAVAFTAAFGLLGFLNESSTATTVFNWFVNISGLAGFIAWGCINASHIAFMRACKAQGIKRESLPYKAFLQPWFSYYGLFFNILIIFTQGFTSFMPWDTQDFFISYISLILFVVLYAGHKLWKRQGFVVPRNADLYSGRKEVDEYEMEIDTNAPTGFLGKAFAFLG